MFACGEALTRGRTPSTWCSGCQRKRCEGWARLPSSPRPCFKSPCAAKRSPPKSTGCGETAAQPACFFISQIRRPGFSIQSARWVRRTTYVAGCPTIFPGIHGRISNLKLKRLAGVRRAGKDLAELVVKSRLQEGLPMLQRVFNRRSKGSPESPAVPPAADPLPWAAVQSGGADESSD